MSVKSWLAARRLVGCTFSVFVLGINQMNEEEALPLGPQRVRLSGWKTETDVLNT
jgi:hypothetical protein